MIPIKNEHDIEKMRLACQAASSMLPSVEPESATTISSAHSTLDTASAIFSASLKARM